MSLPRSAALQWRPLRRFVVWERRVGAWAAQRAATAFLHEFVRFGAKQGWACLFGGAMVGLLLVTHAWYPADAPLSRYDALTLAAVCIQAGMLATL